MTIRRVYVEKKSGFDIEARQLAKELKENLGISGLAGVRVVSRYDVENVPDALFEKAKGFVFSNKAFDEIWEEEARIPDGDFAFGVEYLPGQYDQRADSVETCIRMIEPEAEPAARCARIIVVCGQISDGDREKILKYCINHVDSRQVSFEKPETLKTVIPEPPAVAVIEGFCGMEEEGLRAFGDEMGFAMTEDDLLLVQSYFKDEENREPTVTELKAIDTYWSDHCRHSTFLTKLTEIGFGEGTALVKEAYEDYLRLRRKVYGDEAAEERPVTLMDMATIGAKYLKSQGLLGDLDESEEVNACSIKAKAEIVPKGDGSGEPEPFMEDWIVMFKNETHNHPTEIEPFGGASTCLGGAIRDPLSGRAHVYQAMRVTGCADPRAPYESTLPGKLSQYQITRTAARGNSSYGNQIGVAAGFAEEIYDEGYMAKRMELGALVAAAPAENIVRMTPVKGDAIIMVGGRTGRDGIGGATGSSKEHTEESLEQGGAEVQKGNPLIERDIVRLFRRREASRLIKRCNDFGAGGVSVAIGELAPSIDVDLDKVMTKYDGLDGTELALSESQERMAVVVAADDMEQFFAYAAEENIEVRKVAEVTDTGRFRMFWRGDCIFDLSRKFLDTSGVTKERTATLSPPSLREAGLLREACSSREADPSGCEKDEALSKERFFSILSDINVASQRGIAEYFDSTAGAGTLLMPLGGKAQLTPSPGMAAKLPVLEGDTNTATLMGYGFDPEIAKESPFHSAMYAVLDSCAKVCAMGGDPEKIWLSFQEYFPKLGDDPARWGLPVMALLGALKAQIALGAPSVGGKDSMSGSFEDIDVAPTLVSFAICVADARHILSPEFKKAGSRLVCLECPKDEGGVPDFESFMANMKRVHQLAKEGRILAAGTMARGGLFAAVAKMAVGNGVGVSLEQCDCLTTADYGTLILEIDGEEDIVTMFAGLNYGVIGETTERDVLEIKGAHPGSAESGLSIPIDEIIAVWEAPLTAVFPVEANTADSMGTAPPATSGADSVCAAPPATSGEGSSRDDHGDRDAASANAAPSAASAAPSAASAAPPAASAAPSATSAAPPATSAAPSATQATAKIGAVGPRVFIPTIPGTNSDADSIRAFERAGAETVSVNLLTASPAELHESIKRMAAEIKKSQIIVLPSGGGGEEPESFAKLVTAVFRNQYLAEAVTDLLEQRDGLILGIGGGFQALVKLGLLPYGKLAEPGPDDPALAQNTIGRYMSRIARVRVSSTLSPWLAAAQVGDIHSIPVSYGEGRFVAGEEVLKALAEAGQIATQYVDFSGAPAAGILYNPAGSALAIEGVTSPDGRVFGRMGHPERIARGLYVNVPGNYDVSVFESGVAYFG